MPVSSERHLLIFGASARAAAFSALRAGLRPWCVDLFADADLQARCSTIRLTAEEYPHGFLKAANQGPPGPWMYTGGLENRPALVQRLAQLRPLWGNDAATVARVRSPTELRRLLQDAGLRCPGVRLGTEGAPRRGRWLVKPLAGAGGAGIRFWGGETLPLRQQERRYFQEYIDGEPCAAIYSGAGQQAQLLGVTRQLVGETWLHAAPFHYCGSIGPLAITASLGSELAHLGNTLVAGCGLHGLFGVDFVLRDDLPWPVEVNPRYTAAIEVLEYALGLPALALHQRVFDADAPCPAVPSEPAAENTIGKAILFAAKPLTFPADGPWMQVLREPGSVHDIPAFADIPQAGAKIAAGRPILTFFARATTVTDCEGALKNLAPDLGHRLFAR